MMKIILKSLLAALFGFIGVIALMFSNFQRPIGWGYVFSAEAGIFFGGGLVIGLIFPRTWLVAAAVGLGGTLPFLASFESDISTSYAVLIPLLSVVPGLAGGFLGALGRRFIRRIPRRK